MASRDDDEFRPKVGAPRNKGRAQSPRFVSRVLKEVDKAGPARRSVMRRPETGLRRGRGYAAARLSHGRSGPQSRRVVIKARLLNLKQAAPRSIEKHLSYIQRDGVTRDGGRGVAYDRDSEGADARAFEQRSSDDRHQFRFIVAPEDATDLGNLRQFTRDLMSQMERDLGTRLDWVAVDHWDTDNPHTHIVVRGKDELGHDLVIARDYIKWGMRERAGELATEWLGPRTEIEIEDSLRREVHQERWTSLDAVLQKELTNGELDMRRDAGPFKSDCRRPLLLGRLQTLSAMDLAEQLRPGVWRISLRAEDTLRVAGERGDILRTMQRAMSGAAREYRIVEGSTLEATVTGRLVGKGSGDELDERRYLIVDGIDGRAHYLAIPKDVDTEHVPTGSIVQVSPTKTRSSDETIQSLSREGIYRTEVHLAVARSEAKPGQDPAEFVAAHVRRLEALRRAGVVERLADGVWRVPADLPERARAYDLRRGSGLQVQVLSETPIDRQVRAVGVTWIDRRLLDSDREVPDVGFGSNVRTAMRARLAFLVEEDLAERRGGRVVIRGNLLSTLRDRELREVGKRLEFETGMAYRPIKEGSTVRGVYRRALTLTSGRFALLDDGTQFSLVPWRPVLEKRLGRTVTGIVHRDGVSWQFGRSQEIGR